jgi:uncharacterized damage-inducible protein DinB
MKYLFAFFIFLLFQNSQAQEEVKDAFLEKWNNSKTYLIQVAEAMPESFYEFKPTKREMTFSKQLLHIQSNMNWLSHTYFSSEKKEVEEPETLKTKAAIITSLKNSFDAVYKKVKNTPTEELKTKVDFFAGPKTKYQILNLLQDHVTHHRAQILVYLNLKEITPPSYVGW